MRRSFDRTPEKLAEPQPGARLILVEPGVPSIASILSSTRGGSDLIVHVQQHGADVSSLLHAALRSVGELDRGSGSLERVVLVVGDDTMASTSSARELLTRALVTHMGASGGGELELVGPKGGHLGVREDLWLLVEELLAIACESSVSIRLRFDDPIRRAA